MKITNQKITSEDLDLIRCLPDFDLVMVLSDIHDHGWPMASQTLAMIRVAFEKGQIKAVTARLN